MSDYKELQEWARKKRRTAALIGKRGPGQKFRFRDGSTYQALGNGALVKVSDASDGRNGN